MIEEDGVTAIMKDKVNIFKDTLQGNVNSTVKKIIVRELKRDEFPAADKCWVDYHDTTGDPATDRVFAVFFQRGASSPWHVAGAIRMGWM